MLMLEMWVSFGDIFCPPHPRRLLREYIFSHEIACQKGRVDCWFQSDLCGSKLFLCICFSFRELFWDKGKQAKWILTIIAPVGAEFFLFFQTGMWKLEGCVKPRFFPLGGSIQNAAPAKRGPKIPAASCHRHSYSSRSSVVLCEATCWILAPPRIAL